MRALVSLLFIVFLGAVFCAMGIHELSGHATAAIFIGFGIFVLVGLVAIFLLAIGLDQSDLIKFLKK